MDDITKISHSGKSDSPFIAGYDIVTLQYKYSLAASTNRLLQRRNYARLDDMEFYNTVHARIQKLIDRTSLCSQLTYDIDTAVTSIQNGVIEALDQAAPVTTIQSSNETAIMLDLKNAINHRNQLDK